MAQETSLEKPIPLATKIIEDLKVELPAFLDRERFSPEEMDFCHELYNIIHSDRYNPRAGYTTHFNRPWLYRLSLIWFYMIIFLSLFLGFYTVLETLLGFYADWSMDSPLGRNWKHVHRRY